MLHRTIALLCIAAALGASAQERAALQGAELTKALQAGGYTVYFRHATTDMSQRDGRVVIGDCTTQRNLKAEGREQARKIGATIAALKLPVGEVIASPYCRTMETARLLTGREAVAVDAVLGIVGPSGKPEYTALAKILATPPAQGTLRIIAGHGNAMRDIGGPHELEEGEALVIEGSGSGWKIVARVRPGEWPLS